VARGSGVDIDIEQVVVEGLVEVEDLLGRTARRRCGGQGGRQPEVSEDGLDDGGTFDGLHLGAKRP
jgi:hypothetical protein